MELVQRDVDVLTGAVATDGCPAESVSHEWFLPGTEPTQECAEHAQRSLWDRLFR
jgi:hypothetical protein